MTIRTGDWIHTPRFLKVTVKHVYPSGEAARADGFTEPTHYDNPGYEVLGKITSPNRMIFAAAKK